MKNRKYRLYILLTAAGLLAAIVEGIVSYVWFQRAIEDHSVFARDTYRACIDHVNQSTLRNMAVYVEEQFPVLRDTKKLKAEAGTDWFWETSGELTRLAKAFGFAYIYYIAKDDGGKYRFLMSSGIGREEHPEWLGGPVWSGPAPAFIEEAYATGNLTISPDVTVNEWGSLVSAVLPVKKGGEVAGILGVDYDISFLTNPLLNYERDLRGWEENLRRNLWIALGMFCVLTIVIMFVQIRAGYNSVIVPLQMAEADERARIMMDATPMACSLWDSSGRMLDCNLEALNIFGLSEKSEYIDHFYDLNPEYQPDGRKTGEMVPEYIREALEKRQKCFEWMYLTASGKPLPVETTLVRVPWEDGFRVAAYSRDLREIKAKEAKAREAEDRVRLMVDSMAFACYFFDEKGDLIDCNERAVRLYGCGSKEELLSRFFTLNPERQSDGMPSVERAKEEIYKAFRNGQNTFRWDHITTDGLPLPVEVTLVRVKWQDTYRVIAYARNLTELTETTDNLIRISALINGSPNPVIYLGEWGEIEYTNPAVSEISGFSREELYMYGLPLLFTNERLRLLNEEYIKSARQNRNGKYELEISITRRDGESVDCVFSVVSMPLQNRKIGVGLVGRNITELKRVQRDMAGAKEVAEHALEQEARYNQVRGDFLSRVSHEMLTPLNAVIGMTGIARKAAPGMEQDRCFGVIEAASVRLLDMVNDVLDVTGLDTGGFDWSPAPFSLRKVLREVVEKVTPLTRAKQQDFTAEIDDMLIPDTLVSDERRLGQLLLKLLSNAVKFTPEGGTIGLFTRCMETGGAVGGEGVDDCLIRFEVWDTGIGISPEKQARLWEPMDQADTSIDREYEGLGLGLYLAKRIAELMRGTIRVESEPGKGSRFICDLRLDWEDGAPGTGNGGKENAGNEQNAEESRIEYLDLTGRRILVADDNEINREIVYAILRGTGAELDGAKDGAEAVRKFVERPYDLVFMDIHMPSMNGLDAARGIRSCDLPWARTAPIISLSADTSAAIRVQSMEAGISDYLSKPINVDALFQKTAHWLGVTRPADTN
jgi:PAS domain S-box-containing protein